MGTGTMTAPMEAQRRSLVPQTVHTGLSGYMGWSWLRTTVTGVAPSVLGLRLASVRGVSAAARFGEKFIALSWGVANLEKVRERMSFP